MDNFENYENIAVVIPCYNEGSTIASVVSAFGEILPKAKIYVFDNNSTDNSANYAEAAGATVIAVKKQGKGAVVRAICRDIIADYYLMLDGDNTYPPEYAIDMIALAKRNHADMVVGNRLQNYGDSSSRTGHYSGNQLLTKAVNYLFDSDLQDLLSGYRLMSHRFVKSLPLFSEGFEVETAISIHAIELDARIFELPIKYQPRVEGSASKLNTVRDGTKILKEILIVYKDQKPKVVYGLAALLFMLSGLLIGLPVVKEYLDTGLVPRFPSAILASGLCMISFLCAFTGIILSGISKSRREFKKLSFLALD